MKNTNAQQMVERAFFQHVPENDSHIDPREKAWKDSMNSPEWIAYVNDCQELERPPAQSFPEEMK